MLRPSPASRLSGPGHVSPTPGPSRSHWAAGRPGGAGALATLLVTLLVGCDSGPSAPEIASVRVDAPETAVVVGETLQLAAVPLDPRGEPISGLSATWTSSAAQVLEVNDQGVVTGVALGSATVRAEVNGVAGTRSIQVIPIPVASIEVSPSPVEVVRGSEVQLQVTLRSAAGEILENRVVLYTSQTPQVASVTNDGRVTGLMAGSATIAVTSGVAETVVSVQVLPGDEPVVEGIGAAVVREGEEVEITGERFSPNRLLNEVRLGDEMLEVVEASETRLLVRTPSFVCAPSGPIELIVSVAGDPSSPVVVPFEGSSALSLEPGEFHRVSGMSRPCFRLAEQAGGATYLVGVQSTTGDAFQVVPVRARGLLPTASPDALAPVVAEREAVGAFAAGGAGTGPASFQALAARRIQAADSRGRLLARHQAAERDLRTRETEFLRARGAPGPLSTLLQDRVRESRARQDARAEVAASVAQAGVPGTVQVNDTVNVRVPNIRASSFCTSFIPIRAVVRRVGSGSVWLEDVANPAPNLSSSDYSTLGSQFDDMTLPTISNQFGEPTDVDENGRIVIVISQEVNRFGGVLGFVVTTDFFPSSGGTPGVDTCPSSNEGEFYYSVTPDPQGQITPAQGSQALQISLSEFRSLTPRLAAHEATHIIQFGRRLFETPGATALGTIWELEGQAVMAEEITGFAELGLAPRQNLGFQVAFDPNESQPTDWFSNGFVDLALYYGFQGENSRAQSAPAACSWLGRQETSGPCNYGRLAYGPSWSFQRWVTDHYGSGFPGGEAELMRRLVQATVAGFPAFEEVLGEPVPPLLARWAASLYTDGRLPSGSDPRLSFPSWDLRGIDENLFETATLVPQSRSFSNLNVAQNVAAGSSLYLLVSGTSQPSWAFRASGTAGGTLPGFMQVWVVRLP